MEHLASRLLLMYLALGSTLIWIMHFTFMSIPEAPPRRDSGDVETQSMPSGVLEIPLETPGYGQQLREDM